MLPVYPSDDENRLNPSQKGRVGVGQPLTPTPRAVLHKNQSIIDGEMPGAELVSGPSELDVPNAPADGEWLRMKIALLGYSVWLRAWQVQVGRDLPEIRDWQWHNPE